MSGWGSGATSSPLTLHTLTMQRLQYQHQDEMMRREKKAALEADQERQSYERAMQAHQQFQKEKQAQFDRSMRIAELQAKTAGATGRPAPTGYKDPAVQEFADAAHGYQQALPQMYDPMVERRRVAGDKQIELEELRARNRENLARLKQLQELEAAMTEAGHTDQAEYIAAMRRKLEAELNAKERQGLTEERRLAMDFADPTWGGATRDVYDMEQRNRERTAEKSATNVNIGPGTSELTKANETEQQDRITNANQQIAELNKIEALIEQAGGHKVVSSLSDEWKQKGAAAFSRMNWTNEKTDEWLYTRGKAEAAMSTFSTLVMKSLSGVAISPQEEVRLRKSMPSITDAAPIRKAKLDAWRENADLIRRFGAKYLIEGIRAGSIALPGEYPEVPSSGAGGASNYDDEFDRMGGGR